MKPRNGSTPDKSRSASRSAHALAKLTKPSTPGKTVAERRQQVKALRTDSKSKLFEVIATTANLESFIKPYLQSRNFGKSNFAVDYHFYLNNDRKKLAGTIITRLEEYFINTTRTKQVVLQSAISAYQHYLDLEARFGLDKSMDISKLDRKSQTLYLTDETILAGLRNDIEVILNRTIKQTPSSYKRPGTPIPTLKEVELVAQKSQMDANFEMDPERSDIPYVLLPEPAPVVDAASEPTAVAPTVELETDFDAPDMSAFADSSSKTPYKLMEDEEKPVPANQTTASSPKQEPIATAALAEPIAEKSSPTPKNTDEPTDLIQQAQQEDPELSQPTIQEQKQKNDANCCYRFFFCCNKKEPEPSAPNYFLIDPSEPPRRERMI
jgi:hypothetical protein